MTGFGERQPALEIRQTRRIVGRGLAEVGAQLRVLRAEIPHHSRHLSHQLEHLDLVRGGQRRRMQLAGRLDRITRLHRQRWRRRSVRRRRWGRGGQGGSCRLGSRFQSRQNPCGSVVRRLTGGERTRSHRRQGRCSVGSCDERRGDRLGRNRCRVSAGLARDVAWRRCITIACTSVLTWSGRYRCRRHLGRLPVASRPL